MGLGSMDKQRIWKPWVHEMVAVLKNEESDFRRGRGARSFKETSRVVLESAVGLRSCKNVVWSLRLWPSSPARRC